MGEVCFRVEMHKGRPQAFDIEHLDEKERGPGLEYKKTKLCSFWSIGSCPNGEACPFAHGEADLGTDRAPTADAVIVKSDKVCFDFQRDDCTRGQNCRFQHVFP